MTGQPINLLRPFTLQQAAGRGLTRQDVLTGPYIRVAHGTYLPEPGDDAPVPLIERARAALIHCPPGTVISHHTAGRLMGLRLPSDQRIHVLVPPKAYRSRRTGLAAHHRGRSRDVVEFDGVPCTALPDTLSDLAVQLRLPELVAAVDGALGRRLISVGDLREFALRGRRRGCRSLRQAVELADAASESAMESKTRVLVRLAGYPPPTCQQPVHGASGRGYFLDMGYEQWEVGVEYDGRHHAENSAQYARDQKRREDITLTTWRLVTAVSDDVYVDPAAFLDRLDAAVRAAGGSPPARRPQWSAFFGRS